MDKLSRTIESVTIERYKISQLLFADDLSLLAFSGFGLQHPLNGAAAACEISGMKISASKTEVLHFSRNLVQCFLQVGGVSLKQVEKFKYFRVPFANDEKQDKELDVRSGTASAVMRAFHYLVALKMELSRKAKLRVFNSRFVTILTYGYDFWVMAERVRSQMQASKMRFLRKIK